MQEQIERLRPYILTYQGSNYYLVGDIFDITGIQRSYLYLLIKKGRIKALDKESIKLIDAESFNDYLLSKAQREKVMSKTDAMSKIKELPADKLATILKMIDEGSI